MSAKLQNGQWHEPEGGRLHLRRELGEFILKPVSGIEIGFRSDHFRANPSVRRLKQRVDRDIADHVTLHENHVAAFDEVTVFPPPLANITITGPPYLVSRVTKEGFSDELMLDDVWIGSGEFGEVREPGAFAGDPDELS